MTDLLSFDLDLSKAAKVLAHTPHASTLHRWAMHGVKGVRLKTVKIGGRRFTSRVEIERFIANLSKDEPEAPSTSPADQLRKASAAERAKAIF
jgi:hypothetical protein